MHTRSIRYNEKSTQEDFSHLKILRNFQLIKNHWHDLRRAIQEGFLEIQLIPLAVAAIWFELDMQVFPQGMRTAQ